jgi:hypothetical protein
VAAKISRAPARPGARAVRRARLRAALLLVLWTPGSLLAQPFAGTVVDASTGKPVPDAWVVGKVTAGPRGSTIHADCALEVVRTNARGEYHLPTVAAKGSEWSGTRDTRLLLFTYAPGYRSVDRRPTDAAAHPEQRLVPDVKSKAARLNELARIASGIACQEYLEQRKGVVWPIYRALNDEAQTLAANKPERLKALAVTHWIHVLQYGYEAGIRKTQAERARWGRIDKDEIAVINEQVEREIRAAKSK